MDLTNYCLVDNATTHTIVQDACFFVHILPYDSLVHTISGTSNLIVGSCLANLEFPDRARITIDDDIYSPRSRRILLELQGHPS